MHISTVNLSQTMTDRANITTEPNIMFYVGFRLPYLEETLTYSKGQLGDGTDVSPNILSYIAALF